MNLKAEAIIHDADMDSIFESIYGTIMAKIRKCQAEGSGWTIDSVIVENIKVLKCKPLWSSSYLKLPKELNHSTKGLINTFKKRLD